MALALALLGMIEKREEGRCVGPRQWRFLAALLFFFVALRCVALHCLAGTTRKVTGRCSGDGFWRGCEQDGEERHTGAATLAAGEEEE